MNDPRKHYGPKVCEGYTIDGYIYDNTTEPLWWHVTSGKASVMVQGDAIRDAIATPLENGMVAVRATATSTSLAPPLKAAIFKVVGEWEQERALRT